MASESGDSVGLGNGVGLGIVYINPTAQISSRLRTLFHLCSQGHQRRRRGIKEIILKNLLSLKKFQLREDYAACEYPAWFLTLCKGYEVNFNYIKNN